MANNNEGGWIYVDLESLYEIERVEVLFETAYAKSFEIQTSKDGKTWVTSKTVSSEDFIGDKNIKMTGLIMEKYCTHQKTHALERQDM